MIPEHKNCTHCGACCGPTVATKAEIIAIKKFIKAKPKRELVRMRRQVRGPKDCVYRDNEKERCFIYPVRPEICKLMGVAEGLSCTNGNTSNLDGKELIDITKGRYDTPDFIRR